MLETRIVPATSATVRRRSPPPHPVCLRRPIPRPLDRSIREVAVHVRLPDPVVLPDTDRRQLAALDEPVHGHVRDAHRSRHLTHREEPVTHERPALAHVVTSPTSATSATSAPTLSCATGVPSAPSVPIRF